MLGLIINISYFSLLHYLALIHDDNIIRNMAHHT